MPDAIGLLQRDAQGPEPGRRRAVCRRGSRLAVGNAQRLPDIDPVRFLQLPEIGCEDDRPGVGVAIRSKSDAAQRVAALDAVERERSESVAVADAQLFRIETVEL